MNDLELPPRRPLPPAVRARLRARVDREAPRRAWFRGSLAAAAGVAVLAAGAMMISQSVGDDSQPATAPTTTTTTAGQDLLELTLDRCVAAVAGQGYPPRDQWQLVLGASEHDVTVVAARAGGRPFFCQATENMVTMSNPAEVPRSPGLLLNTPEGVVAGVAEPGWRHVGVLTRDWANTTQSTVAHTSDGLFFLVRGSEEAVEVRVYDVAGANHRPPGWEDAPELDAPGGEVIVVDRPGKADGRAFDACAAEVSSPKIGWVAGARVRWRQDGLVWLVRKGNRVAVCRHDPKPADGREYTWTELSIGGHPALTMVPCRLPRLTTVDDPAPPVGVALSPDARFVDITFHGYPQAVRKPVIEGTVVVQPPWPGSEIEKVAVYDDSLRYGGPVANC